MKLINWQAFAVLAALIFASCTSQINGALREGGSADLTIQASLEPRMSTLIRSLNAMAGKAQDSLLLDGASMSRSIAASPGVGSASLQNTGPAALEGRVVVSRVGDFLSSSAGTHFISYSETSSGGRSHGRFLATLDRSNAPALIALLSADAIDYLTALMAPVILEEYIPRDEYLSLVSSLYGRPIADEISAAVIQATIDFPGPITSSSTSRTALSVSGSRAIFIIPLLDLLLLEAPLSWEVVW
ncbi:MAG: hypothetical protein LBI14_11805 [Treponema sp.]|jgi:hypothetical protein|nr:hypothetical protein [Treponema sp.]